MRKLRKLEVKPLKDKMAKALGTCPLCLRTFEEVGESNVVLDHCHDSGFIRAPLCRNCNGREGEVLNRAKRGSLFKEGEYIPWLRRLLEYWELHTTPQTQYIHPLHQTPIEQEQSRKKKRAMQAAKRRAKAK